jgi:RNA polymerase sigma-54 factor
MDTAVAIDRRLRLEQRVSPAIIARAQLLAASSEAIDRLIEDELAGNPALERVEVPVAALPGTVTEQRPWEPADHPSVLEQVALDARVTLSSHERRTLDFVLGSLDDHGFLTMPGRDIAEALGVPVAQVEAVLALVRELAPVGIACRDVRDCIDAQLQRLDADSQLVALSRTLVAEWLADLAAGRYGALARRLGVGRTHVVAARDLIRHRTRPYPVLERPLRRGDCEPALLPDVVITCDPDGQLHVELVEEQRCGLRVSPAYAGVTGEQAQAQTRRARRFMSRLGERWATLRRVMEHAAHEQRAYVLEGPASQRPLTRAQVAAAVGLHESTVSRAIAGRSAWLPCGRVIALGSFFTSAVAPQEVLRTLVADERRPLSDGELSAALSARGHRVARRTVAKYRAALDIPPSARRSGTEARFAAERATAKPVSDRR